MDNHVSQRLKCLSVTDVFTRCVRCTTRFCKLLFSSFALQLCGFIVDVCVAPLLCLDWFASGRLMGAHLFLSFGWMLSSSCTLWHSLCCQPLHAAMVTICFWKIYWCEDMFTVFLCIACKWLGWCETCFDDHVDICWETILVNFLKNLLMWRHVYCGFVHIQMTRLRWDLFW